MIPERTWRIGEPGADSVCDKNARLMDQMFDRLEKRCGNPDCRFPLPLDHEVNFSAPGYGEICVTCKDMWVALSFMNIKLRNSNYFRSLHDEWVKEQEEEKRNDRERRRKMGLDDL